MKNKINYILTLTASLLILITFPNSAYAATDCTQIPAPLTCISFYIQKAVTTMYAIAGSIALILLIVGGIQWITSGGDPKGLTKARGTLTYAVIGLIIIFLAFVILKLIQSFFGVQLLDTTLQF